MKIKDIKPILKKFKEENILENNQYQFEDILDFLDSSQFGEVPIILYNQDVWINSLIVPKCNLNHNYINDLMNWSIFISSYGYYISKEGYKLSNPCDSYKPRQILSDATPIFLERDIFNHTSRLIEFNQKVSHRLDIAEFKEKNHFYKMNEFGDKENVAAIIEDEELTLAFLNRKELDIYLDISDSVLVRFFNIGVFNEPNPWNCSENLIKLSDKNIYYKYNVQYSSDGCPTLKEIRGFQIINSNQELRTNNHEIEYQIFKVLDIKSGKVVENTCNPEKLGNFFKNSQYIYEISPVFFRTDVFKKYQLDAEKYEIENRYITCKGIWSLRYSLSDDKSQVIVYIKDLGALPEYEQIYWKSFNVEPSSNISEHIFRRDFLGEWDDVIDPLIELKGCLKNFPACFIENNETKIWVEKNKNNIRKIDNLQYIKHPTKEKWDFEIKKLDQIVVEGFDNKKIKKIAKKLDCYNKEHKSLKQLKNCISVLYDENIANSIINPLIKLHDDRNMDEHASNENNYPDDLIQDYNSKIKDCFISMNWLSNEIKKGKFNFD